MIENNEKIDKVKKALLCMQRHSWEQGTAAQAFLEMGEYDTAILMAKEAVVRQLDDGRLGVMNNTSAVTDPASVGEALLFAARSTGETELADAAGKMLDYLLHKAPRAENGAIMHLNDKPEVWVDSFYMSPPFLAATGHSREAFSQIKLYRELLLDSGKRVFSHIWNDRTKSFTRKDFWGVGNGWALAGMTRVMRKLPETMQYEKNLLAGYIHEALDGCIAYMREDGLFHDVIDDHSAFVETNTSQMMAYTIYRGISGGWLDGSYRAYADKMRDAANDKVDSYGLVQGVCGSPAFNSPGTAPEGQSFYLLMETAAYDFYRGRQQQL
ncbi:MAG TPA: glycoside hydrolase family 88 protein [Clostridia bacterium]|nr:glycoside hydrolase family 88 protein [Clostridia bacterium]